MITVNDKRWQDWCDEFIGSKAIRPMSKDESTAFIYLLISEMQEGEVVEQVMQSFPAQVAAAHAKRIGLKCTDQLLALMVAFAADPGTIVMMIHAMRRVQQTTQSDIVKMTTFSEAFPMGIPTPERMNEMWDKQKTTTEERKTMTGIDNYLDYVVNQD